jgi:formamidopyrimidine-DNA glycosylase
MPELPEVETVKRGLEPAMLGQRIARVEVRRKDLRFPFPPRFAERLTGARIDGLRRRAKYILATLDTGETLILHLGMTGRFSVARPDGKTAHLGEFYFATETKGPHDHVVFRLENGTVITYTDPRRFGMMDLAGIHEGENHKLLKSIGVEPLGNDLSAQYLADAFRHKKAPLKSALLDQRIIAGLGNIYVCEALYRARLSPRRKSATLVKRKTDDPRLDELVLHIRVILTQAIAAGGSTLQDYQSADGVKGEFQQRFAVYDREGEACQTEGCESVIRRIVQSGRSTFFCPTCQR